jgi:hypothetical protein
MRRITACKDGISNELQTFKVDMLGHYLHKGIVDRFAALTLGDHDTSWPKPEYTIKHQFNVSAQ